MNPKYPLYIVSKGRSEKRHTVKALEQMNVPFKVVINKEEFEDYAAVIDKSNLLVMPQKFYDEYDTCDNLGSKKAKGPGAARNFAWQHSIENKFRFHWVMDDNITRFLRLWKNKKYKCLDGTCFKVMEDFVERYENIAMAGPAYSMFTKQKQVLRPFILNTRIYSCNLIKNDVPFRWRGRYNEDTILSLDMLKAGWCTIEFNIFTQDKIRTQIVKGGNTEQFYSKEGTAPKSIMQVAVHPDVSRLTFRFGRIHHFVDYSSFQKNIPILKDSSTFRNKVNEYDMKLVYLENNILKSSKNKKIMEKNS